MAFAVALSEGVVQESRAAVVDIIDTYDVSSGTGLSKSFTSGVDGLRLTSSVDGVSSNGVDVYGIDTNGYTTNLTATGNVNLGPVFGGGSLNLNFGGTNTPNTVTLTNNIEATTFASEPTTSKNFTALKKITLNPSINSELVVGVLPAVLDGKYTVIDALIDSVNMTGSGNIKVRTPTIFNGEIGQSRPKYILIDINYDTIFNAPLSSVNLTVQSLPSSGITVTLKNDASVAGHLIFSGTSGSVIILDGSNITRSGTGRLNFTGEVTGTLILRNNASLSLPVASNAINGIIRLQGGTIAKNFATAADQRIATLDFNGAIGTTSTVHSKVYANNITVTDAGTGFIENEATGNLTFSAAGELSTKNIIGNVHFTTDGKDGVLNLGGNVTGSIDSEAGGNLNITSTSVVGGAIGATFPLTRIRLNNTTTEVANVNFYNNVTTTKTQFIGTAGTNINIDPGRVFTSDVEFLATNPDNKITFLANNFDTVTEFIGNITGTGVEIIDIANGANLTGNISDINLIKLDSASGSLPGQIKPITFTGNITNTKLQFIYGAPVTLINGSILGTSSVDFNKQIGTLIVDTDGQSITNVTSPGPLVGGGTVKFSHGGTVFGPVSNISAIMILSDNANEVVVMDGTTASISASSIQAGAGTVQLKGNVEASFGVIGFLLNGSPSSNFEIAAEGTVARGNVVTNVNGTGILKVSNSGTLKGAIGLKINGSTLIGVTPIDRILLSEGVTFSVYPGQINAVNGIDANGNTATVIIKGNQDQTINAPIINAANTTVILDSSIGDQDVKFTNSVADILAPMRLFAVQGDVANGTGKAVEFAENAYITSVVIDGASNIRLNGDGGHYFFGSFELADNLVSLQVNQDCFILNGTSIGNSANGLKDITFTADKTLIIGTAVINLNSLTASTAGQGKLVFSQTTTFNAKNNTGNAINSITATEITADKILTLLGKYTTTSQIKLGGGTLVLNDSINAGAGIFGVGNLVLQNPGAMVLTGSIGDSTSSPASIKFNGTGDVIFAGTVTSSVTGTELELNAANPVTISFDDNTDLKDFTVTNTSGHLSTLAAGNANIEVNRPIGKVGAPVILRLNNEEGSALTVKVANPGLRVTTLISGTGSVNLHGIEPSADRIGTTNAPIGTVIFTSDGTTNDLYANVIKVGSASGGATASLTGMVFSSGDGLQLAHADSKVFLGKSVIDTQITTTAGNNTGVASFTDSTIRKSVGQNGARLDTTTFSGSVVDVESDIYSRNIHADTTKILLKNSITFDGLLKASSFDLGLNTLTLRNPGNTSFVSLEEIMISTRLGNDGIGIINNQSGADLGALKKVVIYIDDVDSTAGAPGSIREFMLVTPHIAVVTPPNVGEEVILPADGLESVVFDVTSRSLITSVTGELKSDGSIIIKQQNVAQEILPALANTTRGASAAERFASDQNLMKEFAGMSEDTATEAIERLAGNSSDFTKQIVEEGVEYVTNKVNAHTAILEAQGFNAGDEASGYGVWVSPLFNKGKQRAKAATAGYDETTYGAIVGIDRKIDEGTLIGAAFSFLDTNVRLRDFKSGDKIKAETMIASFYGIQEYINQLFVQGMISFGSSRISTDEKRITGNGSSQRARGKYNTFNFSIEGLFGYQYVINNDIHISPTIGIRFINIKQDKYTETGTTNQNLTVKRRTRGKVEGVLGFRMYGKGFELSGWSVVPEIHSFVNYSLSSKEPKVITELANSRIDVSPSREKTDKASYNVGTSLSAIHNNTEYVIGYDGNFADKYLNHQFILRLRFNF